MLLLIDHLLRLRELRIPERDKDGNVKYDDKGKPKRLFSAFEKFDTLCVRAEQVSQPPSSPTRLLFLLCTVTHDTLKVTSPKNHVCF